MAVYVQVLLPLCCVLLAQGHVMHQNSHFSSSELPVHDAVNVNSVYNRLNPDLSLGPSRNDRPIDGDVFSYNTQRAYDDYYGNNYNPGLYAYFPYPRYDNRPFGYPNINNGFNSQNPGYPNAPNAPNGYENPNGNPSNNHHHAPNGYQNPNENPSNIHHHPADRNNNGNLKQAVKQQSGNKDESNPSVLEKQSEVVLPKPNKISSDDGPSNENSGALKRNKDYLLVDNNGNILYLLHAANPPITNPIVVPNTNQPVGNNVVYVPYNPQQPGNQVYQILSRQQPTSTSNPMTANRVNSNGYNNVVANPVPNNVPATNPSYVLIYANGQLIQVPGVVLNPAQNVVFPNTVASPNVYQPAQGGNQMFIQLPNGSPVSNGGISPRVVNQHPQLVPNPNNIPNNNGGSYAVVNQPNTQQKPIATPHNMGHGYAQQKRISNPGNQGPVANSENPNPANNNKNNNNQVTNPPNQEKDQVNVSGPAVNNVPPTNGQPNSLVGPSTEPSNNAVTNTLDVIPAVMVSEFKDNQGKDKKKEQENAKDVNKK